MSSPVFSKLYKDSVHVLNILRFGNWHSQRPGSQDAMLNGLRPHLPSLTQLQEQWERLIWMLSQA